MRGLNMGYFRRRKNENFRKKRNNYRDYTSNNVY